MYRKDDDRPGSYAHDFFDFLGYTFRPRLSANKFGKHLVNFTPGSAMSLASHMGPAQRWSCQ